jgi:hypothetical protein
MRAPYARLIRCSDKTGEDHFSLSLKKYEPTFKWTAAGSYRNAWEAAIVEMYKEASPTQLSFLSEFLKKHKCNTMYRIENPNITIFFDNEKLFKDFVITYSDKFSTLYSTRLRYVTVPFTEESISVMNEGKTITNHDKPYKYKVKLKSAYVSVDELKKLAKYIDHAGDEIYFAPVSRRILNRRIHMSIDNVWYAGSQFWTNDLSFIELVSLICPGIIGTVEEVVKV